MAHLGDLDVLMPVLARLHTDAQVATEANGGAAVWRSFRVGRSRRRSRVPVRLVFEDKLSFRSACRQLWPPGAPVMPSL